MFSRGAGVPPPGLQEIGKQSKTPMFSVISRPFWEVRLPSRSPADGEWKGNEREAAERRRRRGKKNRRTMAPIPDHSFGWTVGDYGNVFNLTPEDRAVVENHLAAVRVLKRAAAPLPPHRKTRILTRGATVEMRISPPSTSAEEERIRDSVEALADEAGLPVADLCIGTVRPVGKPSAPVESTVEITLAE